jgi:hypothetical protein
MNDLNKFIKEERAKREMENPQPVQSPANVRNSLLALKNAVDGFAPLEGNPLIENIKKVENVVERKENSGFIQPVTGVKSTPKAPMQEPQMMFEEKEDKFTKDLLLKTRQFITGGTNVAPSMVTENTPYHPPVVEPDPRFNYVNPSNFNYSQFPSKNDVLSALKDTITDLYVKEKVEAIIKEYLQTDEGKMLIKSIVVGLFKKR